MLNIIISLLIVIGAAFVLVGSYELTRLPDFYMRLHAPIKTTTLDAVLCGQAWLQAVFRSLDASVQVRWQAEDGDATT